MTPDIIFLNNKIEYFQNRVLDIEYMIRVINFYWEIYNIVAYFTAIFIIIYIGYRGCILAFKNTSPVSSLLWE